MKTTREQQQALLDLAGLDLEIARNNRALAELNAAVAREAMHADFVAASEQLLNAKNALDALQLELNRLEQDLELVESRIAKDRKQLDASSSSKDNQGINHELASLDKRKSTLEDAELELLERKEAAEAEVAEAAGRRAVFEAALLEFDSNTAAKIVKQKSSISLLAEQRTRLAALLSDELNETYAKLANRGMPVGRLEGLACSACGLTLSGAAIDQIRATPSEEIARCPECSALLVRI